jgi:DNA-binding IclR family transcriptional regulator
MTTISRDRLLHILRLFAAERASWTAAEIAARFEVSLSTAYRDLALLVESGFLDPVDGSKAYVLGPAIVEFDRVIRRSDPLVSAASGPMQRLAAKTPVAAFVLLCRRHRDAVMCVHEERAGAPTSDVSYERGRPMPLLRGASSKIMLAQMPPRQLRALFERLRRQGQGPKDAAGWTRLQDELRSIRKAGVCMLTGEVDRGVTGIAVPLVSAAGNPIASLGFASFVDLDAATVGRMTALLRAAATDIEAGLRTAATRHAER